MAGGNRLLLSCEMLETLRLQLPDAVLFGNANLAGLLCDLTDAGDPHAINSLWKPRGIVGRNGEQQLEILIAPGPGHHYPNLADHKHNVEYDINRVIGVLGNCELSRPPRAEGKWVVVTIK